MGAGSWTKADYDRKRRAVADLQARLSTMHAPKEHPFWGSQFQRTLLPSELAELKRQIDEAASSLETLIAASQELVLPLHLDTPANLPETGRATTVAERVLTSPDLKRINIAAPEWETRRAEIWELIGAGEKMADIHAKCDQTLLPAAWNADVLQMRLTLQAKGRSFWRFLSSDYQQAKNQLATICRPQPPKDIQAQIDLADAILEERQMRGKVERLSSLGAAALGGLWRSDRTDWKSAAHVNSWVYRLDSDIASGKVDPAAMNSLKAGFTGPQSRTGWSASLTR